MEYSRYVRHRIDFQQQQAGKQESIVGRVAVILRTMWDRGLEPMSTRNG
jgi:hypothetical protein